LGVKNTFLHAERGVRDSLLAYDHVSRSAPTPDLQTSPISSDGFGGLLAPGFGPSANANQAASGLLWPAASVFDAPAASGGASGEHSSPLSSSPLMQQFQSMQNFQQQVRICRLCCDRVFFSLFFFSSLFVVG
jgi:hypothetical protein